MAMVSRRFFLGTPLWATLGADAAAQRSTT